MPWKERNALDQRNEFIGEWLERERPVAELSRIYGVSRKTAYKWLERFGGGGRAGLADRSRAAPHHSPQAIMSEAVAAAILAARQKHPTGARASSRRAWSGSSRGEELAGGEQHRGITAARRPGAGAAKRRRKRRRKPSRWRMPRRRTKCGARISKVVFAAAMGRAVTRSR